MTKLNLDVIGIVGVPASYGGFETLAQRLIENEEFSRTYNIRIFCSSPSYAEKKSNYLGADLFYLPLKANGFQSVLYDSISILISIFSKTDVVLILGISGAMFIPLIKLCTNKKVVVNIDGMESKRDKWSGYVRKILKLFENIAVRWADIIISDNDAIKQYIKSEYRKESEMIAYGGDINTSLKSPPVFINGNEEFYLSICRIEKENNVKLILDAFADNKEKKLFFIGNWNSTKYGIKLRNDYSNFDNINLIEPIYDEPLLNYLRSNAKGYIHGHSAGGTNPSLVEAMFFKAKIFAFNCNFNVNTLGKNNGIFFDDAQSLSGLLREKHLRYDYKRVIEYAKSNYNWHSISQKYISVLKK